MVHYTSDSVYKFAHAVLGSFGCDSNEREIVARHLLDANLTGHDSHGVGMLPLYGEQVLDGNLIPNQSPVLHPPEGAISIVDARFGFGHRIALLALDHAMQGIDQHKVAILALKNSGHVSRVGTYSEYCAGKGYVSIHVVNVVGHQPIVAPFGAAQSGFSTNPISAAIPIKSKAKPLLDLATSTVAFGKVRVASNNGEKMPPGCLVDENGCETTDPDPMANDRRGSLAAFGAHKGSGLGIMIELLAGALAGDHTVTAQPALPRGVVNNMFSIIIDPGAMDSRESIEERCESFCEFIKSLKPADGIDEVLLPGEPEAISRTKRRANGIPIDPTTIAQIEAVVTEFEADAAAHTLLLREA
ncbi:MAG: Ldh family oxidoreductase [Granulosicoccus sp.]|nr:Ldh family oxidoreductase [Granulosicoccus sp.]